MAERTFGQHMDLLDTAIEGGDVSVVIWLRDYARYHIGPHADDYAKKVLERLAAAGYKAEVVSNIKPNTDPKLYARNTIADAMDELQEWSDLDEVRLDHELDRITRANLSLAFQREILNEPQKMEEPQAVQAAAPLKPYSP
jgi:hypothetical protein